MPPENVVNQSRVDSRDPSEVNDVYWLFARRRIEDRPQNPGNVGKWLIFVSPKHVNKVWAMIKDATEEGLLGCSAKVATGKPNSHTGKSKSHVICVYTVDYTDETDVRRVREKLRELGITAKIPYKTDSDTLAGKYATRGEPPISSYFE